jgi:DNA-binding SARP family transcriptional activator
MTSAERQRAFRARKAAQAATEVRERAAELLAEGEQDEDAYYDWLDSQREAA